MRAARLALIIPLLMLSMIPFWSRPNSEMSTLIESMSLEQRVGQVFMVSANGQGVSDTVRAFLTEVMPGGVALFSDNGGDPAQTTASVNAWQAVATTIGAHIPLLTAIDQEGGPVTRLADGFSTIPAGWLIGALPVDRVRKVGQIVGQELGAVGINMNLAPVTDVQTIPDNSVMNGRTFGSDAGRVGAAAGALDQGLADGGVIGVLKHFPGHGDASDSHVVLPTVLDPLDRVQAVELEAFRIAIRGGAEAVMVGHLVYPALDPTPGLPASLSPRIIGDVLRGQLGFDGLIMTDAMDMGAIVENFGRGDSAVLALKAGVDLVVTGPHMPLDGQREMVHAVLNAIKKGDLSEARLNEAVGRVLALKAKHGLLTWLPPDPTRAAARVDQVTHQAALDAIFADGITIARDTGGLLPLKRSGTHTLVLYPAIYPSLQRVLAAHDPAIKALSFAQAPGDDEIGAARVAGRAADVIIAFTLDAAHQPRQAALINALPPGKTIVVALQNPYDYSQFPAVAGYVLTYMPMPAAFPAIGDVLYGARQAHGVLPVTLSIDLKAGTAFQPPS